MTDTIAALATGTGGAISIIRLSGPRAIAIADALFRPASGVPLSQKEGYTISYGSITAPGGEVVDQALVSLFRAPRSYTGEDMAEISLHASPYIVRRVTELLLKGGARAAEAGEFTVRAFLAGKMDLSQAEAVADMIASTDRAAHALAIHQMRGGYSEEFASLRAELLHLASMLELELDFSEEEVEFADRQQLDALMTRIGSRIGELTASFSLGNALKEGVPVAIAGEPNVGKSTLLNALLREDRAMVSDIAGTTRDVIEESITLDGIRFRFLDTAGLRDTADTLEKMGIERTHSAIERARIILWVADASDYIASPGSFATPPLPVREDQKFHLLVNKIDCLTADQSALLEGAAFGGPQDSAPVFLGAKNGINLQSVIRALVRDIAADPLHAGGTIISNARHHEALLRAGESLSAARAGLAAGIPDDLLCEDIRDALHHLGTITGQITTDEILGNIFSKFCIGK